MAECIQIETWQEVESEREDRESSGICEWNCGETLANVPNTIETRSKLSLYCYSYRSSCGLRMKKSSHLLANSYTHIWVRVKWDGYQVGIEATWDKGNEQRDRGQYSRLLMKSATFAVSVFYFFCENHIIFAQVVSHGRPLESSRPHLGMCFPGRPIPRISGYGHCSTRDRMPGSQPRGIWSQKNHSRVLLSSIFFSSEQMRMKFI